MFTIGSFRSRTPQICDAAGSNFSQRRLPAHARPFKFDASLSYKTRVKGIWRCVENVSINWPFFKTKWIRMYLLNLKFKTQIHGETFLRKFTLQLFILSRIFVCKETFIVRRVRKSLIHYTTWFLRKKTKFFIIDFLFFIPSTLTSYLTLGFIKRFCLLFLWK